MCKVLKISRSTYYYEEKAIKIDDKLIEIICEIFRASRNNYGTRKIKKELLNEGFTVSRRRIGRIMAAQGLVSKYTVAQFKPHKTVCNEAIIENKLNREFDGHEPLSAVVSDLTYVRVGSRWNYVCILVDLFNREIIGHSCGRYKDAPLVYRAFAKIEANLEDISIFHTDRGGEFDNKLIDDVLNTFNIERSLSMKGCPYDNAVAEAMFKVFKTEFIKGYQFDSIGQLELELADYVHWFNNQRIHGTLGYITPKQYRIEYLKKTV